MLSILCVLAFLQVKPVETQFMQSYPLPCDAAIFERSKDQTRAVVLLHGLRAHLFSEGSVATPSFHDWQRNPSQLVQMLAKDADVYAFAYGQNVPVNEIARTPELAANLRRLKWMGYRELVLIGHSAGGLIARQFVEDYPEVGVTKVIQVCTPNGGSSWSKLRFGVRPSQEAFLDSLSKAARQQCLKCRSDKKIPSDVQFVCVVANGGAIGDGVVSCHCQWTEELQIQGIPAVPLFTTHFWAMRSKTCAEKLAQLTREDQPRLDETQRLRTQKLLFGSADQALEKARTEEH
jgi:hypothetical protein